MLLQCGQLRFQVFGNIFCSRLAIDIQSVSLVPLLKGEKPVNWRKALYYHFYEYPAEHMVKRHYGVRTDRYKLIHFYNDIDEWELYDLQADPTEMRNIYGQPGTKETGCVKLSAWMFATARSKKHTSV